MKVKVVVEITTLSVIRTKRCKGLLLILLYYQITIQTKEKNTTTIKKRITNTTKKNKNS